MIANADAINDPGVIRNAKNNQPNDTGTPNNGGSDTKTIQLVVLFPVLWCRAWQSNVRGCGASSMGVSSILDGLLLSMPPSPPDDDIKPSSMLFDFCSIHSINTRQECLTNKLISLEADYTFCSNNND
jgi:hypothetical protein